MKEKKHMTTATLNAADLDKSLQSIDLNPSIEDAKNKNSNMIKTVFDIIAQVFSSELDLADENHKEIFRAVLGKRIRIARKSVGLSITDLANEVNISRQMLSQLELGKNGIKKENRERIYNALRKHGANI